MKFTSSFFLVKVEFEALNPELSSRVLDSSCRQYLEGVLLAGGRCQHDTWVHKQERPSRRGKNLKQNLTV